MPNHHLACTSKTDQQDSEDSRSDCVVQDEGAEALTIAFDELRKRWHSDPEFQKEYDALRPEFRLARELIEARTAAGLSQREVAHRMGTRQPAIARMESGRRSSLRSLERYAEAVGRKLEIHLVAD